MSAAAIVSAAAGIILLNYIRKKNEEEKEESYPYPLIPLYVPNDKEIEGVLYFSGDGIENACKDKNLIVWDDLCNPFSSDMIESLSRAEKFIKEYKGKVAAWIIPSLNCAKNEDMVKDAFEKAKKLKIPVFVLNQNLPFPRIKKDATRGLVLIIDPNGKLHVISDFIGSKKKTLLICNFLIMTGLALVMLTKGCLEVYTNCGKVPVYDIDELNEKGEKPKGTFCKIVKEDVICSS